MEATLLPSTTLFRSNGLRNRDPQARQPGRCRAAGWSDYAAVQRTDHRRRAQRGAAPCARARAAAAPRGRRIRLRSLRRRPVLAPRPPAREQGATALGTAVPPDYQHSHHHSGDDRIMSSTIIDLHILHTVPPSNLNRDDTGSPKTATYGGVRRARVSSQAWKRATRRDFADHLDESELGERTRYVVDKIAQQISRIDSDLDQEEAANRAAAALAATGIKVTEPKGKGKDPRATTGYLLFLSRPQIVALAELGAAAEDGKVDKKAAKEVLKKGNSIDLALFGRMVADVPELNVDAACQVAHAISVHPVD